MRVRPPAKLPVDELVKMVLSCAKVMPSVKKGESRESYMGRCMPIAIKEGVKPDAAKGKCEGMFDSKWRAHSADENIGALNMPNMLDVPHGPRMIVNE